MKRIMQGAIVGAVGCAGIVAASAAPASAAVTNGSESVSLSSPYTVAVQNYSATSPSPTGQTSNAYGPAANQGVINGSGYTPNPQDPIFVQVCDGTSPTSTGYTVSAHCSNANTPTIISSNGTFSINTAIIGNQFAIFHGEDPGDDRFNCLSPEDDPNGTVTVDGNQPIDNGLPSWGASSVGQSGGGTAPCQLRIGYGATYSPSDIYIPLTALDANPSPGTQAPESPLAVALPVAGVAILGAGSVVAVRRRRRRSSAAA